MIPPKNQGEKIDKVIFEDIKNFYYGTKTLDEKKSESDGKFYGSLIGSSFGVITATYTIDSLPKVLNSTLKGDNISSISKISYKTENTSLALYDKSKTVATNGTLVPPLTTNKELATVPLLTNGVNKVGQVQSTLTPKANVNNMDLLKAFKRVEDKKNYYYSKLTTTMEIEGVKFRFPSIEYALNERATEELQKNPLTMPTEMQEHIFGEIKHLRNGTIKATGGHAVSDQVKISEITNIQYNNVFQAKVEIYDPVTNQYILKSNNNGLSTFFPPYWTKDRILIEAESAFGNKVPHSDPDMLQKGFDEGKTKSGVKVDIGRKTLYF